MARTDGGDTKSPGATVQPGLSRREVPRAGGAAAPADPEDQGVGLLVDGPGGLIDAGDPGRVGDRAGR